MQMTTMKIDYGIKQISSKFVVTKNGEPIILPASEAQSLVTQFDSKEDAEKYLSILKSLNKQKHYK